MGAQATIRVTPKLRGRKRLLAALTALVVGVGAPLLPAASASAADPVTGTIVGTLVSEVDLLPVAGAEVTLTRYSSCRSTVEVGTVESDEAGAYSFADVPMDRICAQGSDEYRIGVAIPDQPRLQPSPWATTIALAAGETRADILLDAYAMVSGTVTARQGGTPVAGAVVGVFSDGDEPGEGVTDENGYYEAYFPGDIEVAVVARPADPELWTASSEQTFFGDHEAKVVDLQLDDAMFIQGRVTDTSAPFAPLAGIEVRGDFTTTGNYSVLATTDAEGRYSVRAGDRAGRSSTLDFRDPADVYLPFTGRSFTGVANTTESYDVRLQKGARVSGTVTRGDTESGLPLIAARVSLTNLDNTRLIATTSTSADGTYTLANVPEGSYLLTFSSDQGYAQQWWSGRAAAAQSTPITVEAGTELTGFDARLQKAAAFTGSVVLGASGEPAAGTKVTLTRADGSLSYAGFVREDGTYRIPNVYYGGYTVEFTSVDARYRTVYSGGSADPERAQTVTVLPSGEARVDAALQLITPPTHTDRVAGADRYEAAVNVAKKAYPGGADTVYVVTGQNYPDALSAGPAAVAAEAPLLLTLSDTLPATVKKEIERLAPEEIVIVGGVNSVSKGVEKALAGIAEVERVSGDDRYDTSREVAAFAFGDGAETAYIATGANFPDALSAGAAAGSRHAPVVLVDGSATGVDSPTTALLDSLGAEQLLIAGGTASVSAKLADRLGELAAVERLSGSDRYGTSVAINAEAFGYSSRAFLVTGLTFPDALSGSAWAGAEDAPLYVSKTDCVPRGVVDAMTVQGVNAVTLIGGTNSLSAAVAELEMCPI